jgi:hypothetical protein
MLRSLADWFFDCTRNRIVQWSRLGYILALRFGALARVLDHMLFRMLGRA